MEEKQKMPTYDPTCPFTLTLKEKKKKNAHIIVSWSMKLQEFGKWERWSYTGSDRRIRNSNKTLWEMERKIRLGLGDWSIAKALFTWNGKNNTEVTYEMRKNNEATIPKKTDWCPVLWHFYQEITWPKSKRSNDKMIKIIIQKIVTVILAIMIIIKVLLMIIFNSDKDYD